MSINPIKHLILMKQTNILDLFGFKSFHGSALHVGKMGLIIFTAFYLVINPQVIQERKISIHSLAECGLMLLSLSKNIKSFKEHANTKSGMHSDCKNLYNSFVDQHKGREAPLNKMVNSN